MSTALIIGVLGNYLILSRSRWPLMIFWKSTSTHCQPLARLATVLMKLPPRCSSYGEHPQSTANSSLHIIILLGKRSISAGKDTVEHLLRISMSRTASSWSRWRVPLPSRLYFSSSTDSRRRNGNEQQANLLPFPFLSPSSILRSLHYSKPSTLSPLPPLDQRGGLSWIEKLGVKNARRRSKHSYF